MLLSRCLCVDEVLNSTEKVYWFKFFNSNWFPTWLDGVLWACGFFGVFFVPGEFVLDWAAGLWAIVGFMYFLLVWFLVAFSSWTWFSFCFSL